MRTASSRPLLAPVAAALLAACGASDGPPHPAPLADPLRLTGGSPYPARCNPPASGATLYLGAEAEPHLAIDPADQGHLVAAWQQDRWRGGGANGTGSAVSFDGGRSWTRGDPGFTTCAGGAPGVAWDRTSDPWVSVGGDGTTYLQALAFDNPWDGTRSAILASRSGDGGRTWEPPITLEAEAAADQALDKNSLTADPARAGFAYAVWDRLAGLTGPEEEARGPARLSRTRDGGASWEGPWTLHDPGADAQTISNQIAVLPDGALVNLLVLIRQASSAAPMVEVAVLRSIDADADPLVGPSWTGPYTVSGFNALGVEDPLDRHPVRAGDIVPAVAVDRSSGPRRGWLYVAWQHRFGGLDGIALSRSADGGLTWSPPARVSADPSVPAFTPSLAVAGSGRVGLGYYDWREPPGVTATGLWTTRWLATSDDGGDTWVEAPDGGPFDLRRAPDVPGYFLGDYMGLVGGGDGFTSLFTMTRDSGGDRTDLFVGPPQP